MAGTVMPCKHGSMGATPILSVTPALALHGESIPLLARLANTADNPAILQPCEATQARLPGCLALFGDLAQRAGYLFG